MNDNLNATAICDLNDQLRQSLRGGVLVMTAGVIGLSQAHQLKTLDAVAKFDSLGEGTTPTANTTSGRSRSRASAFFWKIDYFDRALTRHSPNPADPSVMTRVLTIMLTEEY